MEKAMRQGSTDILYLAHTEDHVNAVLPLVRGLPTSTNWRVIAPTVEAKKCLQKNRVPFATYDEYVGPELYESIEEKARFLARHWFELESVRELAPCLASYKGISLGKQIGSPVMHVFIDAMIGIRVARKILDTERPRQVVVVDDSQKMHSPYPHRGPSFTLEPEGLALLADLEGVHVTKLQTTGSGYARQSLLQRVKGHLKRYKFIVLIYHFLEAGGTNPRFYASAFREIIKQKRKPQKSVPSRGNAHRILLFADGYFARRMLPLLRQAAQDPQIELIWVYEGRLSQEVLDELSKIGIRTFDLWDYERTTSRLLVPMHARSLAHKWNAFRANEELRSFLTMEDGACLWNLVEGYFEFLFCGGGFRHLMSRAWVVEAAVDSVNPDLVMTMAEGGPNESGMLLLCKQRGIPSLAVLHGIPMPAGLVYRADKRAVWGRITQAWFVENAGARVRDCITTGFPYFDTYAQKSEFDLPGIYAELGLNPSKRLILFLDAMGNGGLDKLHYFSKEKAYRTVLESVGELSNCQVIIRTHPGSDRCTPQLLAEESGIDVLVNPEIDLRPLLAVSDVVITQNTTAGLEAIMNDKPVIYLNIFCEPDILPFATRGAALGVYNPEDLAPTIRGLLDDALMPSVLAEKRQQFIDDYCYKIDGQASKRVLALAKKMIEERKNQSKLS